MAGVRGLSAGEAAARLATGRLVLRLLQPGLEGAMARFLRDNFEGHLDRWSPPTTPEFFTAAFWSDRAAIALEEYHADRAARWVLQLAGDASGAVIGTCNYTNIVRGAFHACHLGYQLAREHEGRGLMAEALRETNRFMFAQRRLHRIMANYRPENVRSGALLKRLGFVEEGLAARYLYIDGAWRDHVLTALVNDAFEPGWLAPPR